MGTLFERLAPPPQPVTTTEQVLLPAKLELIQRGPLLKPVVPSATQNDPPLARLLDWLVNHWPRSIIDVRSICIYGPRPRNRKKAIELAETLAANGWLEPLKSHRRDRRVWRIARGPAQSDNPIAK
jgi:hypothetical protein